MTLTDIAAGLGAATGTISLLWEIYKWAKSGPKLIVSVNPHMVTSAAALWPTSGQQGSVRFITVSVANREDQKTTVQALGFRYFVSGWKRIVLHARWLSNRNPSR